MGGAIVRNLQDEQFRALCGELAGWRIDSIIRDMEKNKEPGRILGFIRGLRLSARLIYAIREALSSSEIEADWGHILVDEGKYCSKECDIIIHRRGYKRKWNGSENPVMDFRFIDCKEAIAVISCKSYITSIDKDYCENMSKLVKEVWLFAECCNPKRKLKLTESAHSAGYKHFWYLYEWDGKKEILPNENCWLDFIGALEKLHSKIAKEKK